MTMTEHHQGPNPQGPAPKGRDPEGRDAELVERICTRYHDKPDALIEIFHDLQHAIGHVPSTLLPVIAKRLNLTRAEVHGVMSFYHDFHAKPVGSVVVKVCRAEACQSMGALTLIERICDRLNVSLGETHAGGTSSDRSVTVLPVYCLGNCALAPAAMVDGTLIGRADEDRVVDDVYARRLEESV